MQYLTSAADPDTMTALQRAAEALRTTAEDAYKTIRTNADISGEKRQRDIASAYVTLVDAMARLQEDGAIKANTARADLERRLYGIPNSADASASISYRDALDRAASLEDESAAVAMLRRAHTSGDTLLTRALLATSFDNQWVDTINAYVELEPNTATDIEALWNARNRAVAGAFDYVYNKPAELGRLDIWAIRALAAQEA
ncbi:hypothetical protein [Herbiconiux solani]|uniref:hypothetical protein n=1 Tax=Herbiconiux solani TaxID=661329 RepID=UPI000825D720|nr:hypothetical protein [Herbiconiux solani]